MDIASHPTSRQLIDDQSPPTNAAYKQREDLLDAAICAWTAARWHRHGTTRCQVLGVDDTAGVPSDLLATVVAPARDAQRPNAVA